MRWAGSGHRGRAARKAWTRSAQERTTARRDLDEKSMKVSTYRTCRRLVPPEIKAPGLLGEDGHAIAIIGHPRIPFASGCTAPRNEPAEQAQLRARPRCGTSAS